MADGRGTQQVADIWTSDVDEMRRCAGQLFEDHWQEIALNKGVMTLSPNWKSYYELEERGQLVALAAWFGDELVGYSVSFVFPHSHYSQVSVMQNDVLFVDKAHRKGGLGLRLIAETENIAAERGCQVVLFHSKKDTTLGKILDRRGYGIQDIIHSKVI
jgi:GNAT superfamily N-acetyltransferase